MPGPTPQQIRMRERFEAVSGLAAPVLDLVLAAGDRLSRVVGPENEYYPIRPPGEAFERMDGGAVRLLLETVELG